MNEPPESFLLEDATDVPPGVPLFTDDEPHRYWLLSNGRSWKLVLGQNIRNVPPNIFVAKSGIIFVGLDHGSSASIRPSDGSIIDRVKLFDGNMVFWNDCGGLIIAGGELEVGVFSLEGKFLWRASLGDVIVNIEHENDVVELTDFSGNVSRYEARTGRLL